MDLDSLRQLLFSPAVATTTAAAVSSFVIGYYAGVGRSLFAYNQSSRRRLARDTDEDDDGSDFDDEDEQGAEGNDMRARAAHVLEECKMMLLVRTDLKMDKGKIAAQCGHATLAAYKAALKETPEWVRQWERLGQAKVAVKCDSESTLIEVEHHARRLGVAARTIQDAGRTQIAAGSRTVLGLGPAPKSLMDSLTGHLKLL
ncbi:hypothetical protein V8E36_001022 [Tilletia maclaganii]